MDRLSREPETSDYAFEGWRHFNTHNVLLWTEETTEIQNDDKRPEIKTKLKTGRHLGMRTKQ